MNGSSWVALADDVAEDLAVYRYPASKRPAGGTNRENNVTALKTDALEARERRLDDAAVAKGLVVSKARSEKQDGRYIIVGQPKMIRSSRNAAFPYSFSIEEAEVYVAGETIVA